MKVSIYCCCTYLIVANPSPPPPPTVISRKFKGVAPLKDLTIPFLGIYPEKTTLKGYMHLNVHSSTVYYNQDVEAA